MAVRTVRRGSPGMLYGLIFFVVLTLVAVALNIYLYGELDKQRKVAAEASDNLDKYATSSDRNQPWVKAMLASAAAKADEEAKRDANKKVQPQSLAENLKLELDAIKNIVAKNPTATREQIERELKNAWPGPEGADKDKDKDKDPQAVYFHDGDVVTSFVANIKTKYEAAVMQSKDLEEKLKEAQERVKDLDNKFKALQAQRTEKIAGLTQQVTAVSADYTTAQAAKDAQLAEINKKMDDALAKAADEIRQKDSDVKALQTQIAKLQVRIKQLGTANSPQRPTVPDLSREVDGRIISMDPNHTLVYIDIGRLDHLVLGTTFEVFDAARGVDVSDDGKELKRGKATIEVVTLSDHTAACRIVRSSYSQSVVVNDVIANLVYDKNRVFKFYLFGDFDLDGDGVASLSERETVLTLIRDWGGQVAKVEDRQKNLAGLGASESSLVPVDTDFVIIGREPELPKPAAAGETRPEAIREGIQAKQRWDTYIRVKNEAAALSIPIINQNRFLALIGYYKR